MTEAEWLGWTRPGPMLNWLQGKASDRKLRLFACACCWHVFPYPKNYRTRRAIEIGEQMADGLVSQAEWMDTYGTKGNAANGTGHPPSTIGLPNAWQAALYTCGRAGYRAPRVRCGNDYSRYEGVEASEIAAQCKLLRDIVNPFQSVSLEPSCLAWNDATVLKLAQAVYDDRAFDRLPILADALDEAGCDNQDILDHCRSSKEHVRGCWVVDLILGKS